MTETATDRRLSPERVTILKTAASLTPMLIEQPLIAALYHYIEILI